MDVDCADVHATGALPCAVLFDTGRHLVGTRPFVLRKTEVVVRRQVEQFKLATGERESQVVVVAFALKHGDVAARNAGDGTAPAVAAALVQSAREEAVKVPKQRCIALWPLVSTMLKYKKGTYVLLAKVQEGVGVQASPEKVADVAKDDEDQEAKVGCKQHEPWYALVLFPFCLRADVRLGPL